MKLQKFTGKSIYGIRDFNVRFKTDITFLTGINGSGKTSVLNAIVALISPLLQNLAEMDYESIKIEFRQDSKKGFIEATKNNQLITLRSSETDVVFEFKIFIADQDLPTSRKVEFEYEYYSDILTTNSDNPVLKFIASLPTPMFLGLDRRARFPDGQIYRERSWLNRSRTNRNVFSPSLSVSLRDASSLAEAKYRDVFMETTRAGDSLRRELLLKLLAVEPATRWGPITIPNKDALASIREMRKHVAMLPQILDLKAEEVNERISPFLDLLQKYAAEIQRDRKVHRDQDVHNVLRNRGPDDPTFSALIGWSVNISQLSRIKSISELVEIYNKNVSKIREPIIRYQNLVNKFLHDSGKSLSFDRNGNLFYTFDKDKLKEERLISSLSSGEAQIFVILSHLSFNPYAQSANVFIIDEPELSLHIQWQELFVESILSANPNIQYILATHSPSIILDKVDRCVDLTRDAFGRLA